VAAVLGEARLRGARSVTLVSVQGSQPFWERHGFATAHGGGRDDGGALSSYGADANLLIRS
jgi:hypothetical protein